ncbi:MAG TPA: DnaB-like helicase C-terminal domain-containing protein [Candidatus Ozemobacteraceae bacterium]|nr:DnaB-like helicase C-terminal domain-containing protein [Candidatus Ozemobacteraceae bacterium]
MAKCPECNRELPLSGKCPFCQRPAAPGGFSFKDLLQKRTDGVPPVPPSQPQAGPSEPPPVVPAPPSPAPTTGVSGSSHPGSPLPPSPAPTPLSPDLPSFPPLPSQPSGGSVLAGLRAKAGAGSPLPPASPPVVGDAGPHVPSERPSPLPVAPSAPERDSQAFLVQRKGVADAKAVLGGEQPGQDTSVFSSKITGLGDEEMECSVLAGLLNDSYILEAAASKGLIADLFSTSYSRAICKAIMALREENRDGSLIDKIIIKNKLKHQGLFDLPMQNYLNRVIAQPSPTLDQVLHYLELMKEQALKRRLKEIATNIHEFIDNPDPNKPIAIEHFTTTVIEDIRNVQKAKATKRINLVKEEMREIIKDIDEREVKGEVEIIGYSFEPFHYLNVAVSGFRKGFMYAIAGAPRRGKTTFTLELATSVATNCKIPVLFFTYEQTKKNLTYRLLAKESRLNPDSLQRKKVRSDMIMDAKFMGGWKRMQSYMDYFYIVEATKADTIDRIRTYAYNVMQDFNTHDLMIFVDYIQKMPLSRAYMDEKFKVEEISTELKALSIELNNPIMTISSLSKEGCMIDATESPERPTMYHCKGSGDLEYDLDCAMIQAKDWGDTKELHNQLMHKAEEMGKDPTRVPKVDVVNLYLDKNRDAPEGIYSTLQYLFFIEDNKFIELGPKYDDDRFRFSKIESLVNDLIERNYIIFFDKEKDNALQKGRVQIKLKNV